MRILIALSLFMWRLYILLKVDQAKSYFMGPAVKGSAADMNFISALFIVACVFLAVIYRGKKKLHPKYPPGPPCLPVLGHLHIINMKKPYLTLSELSKKYGSVYSLQVGTRKTVVLCGYDTVKDALVNHAEEFAARGSEPILGHALKGKGLLSSNGRTWKAMRRFTLSALRNSGMGKRTIEDKITEECESLVKMFETYNGKPFDNSVILNAALSNIIVSILFNHHYEYDDPKLLKLLTTTSEINRNAGTPMAQLYNAFPSLVRWLPGSHKVVLANAEELHSIIRGILMNQMDQLSVNDQKSFVDAFLLRQKEERPDPRIYFSNENLTTLVVDLLLAGTETTAITLQWGLLLMMKYPEIQKNVQDEIHRVIGSREPCFAHRKQMPYTDAVIHEIQRFANVIPVGIPRSTTQDLYFKGFFIPKRTTITPVLYSVLRDKAYFEKPEEFYPQHFLDSDGNFVNNEALIAFSAGKRMCVGENLAKMELFLFFTTLLQHFTIQIPPGAEVGLTPDIGYITPPMKHRICAIPCMERDAIL